jgi:sugar/nucleoside kinase (ribokinase family)
VSILSPAALSLDLSALDEGMEVFLQTSPATTTFQNIYDAAGKRAQYVSAQADPLNLAPALTPPPDVLHLAPLLDEVSPDYAAHYPKAKLALTPQGWMRRLGEGGRVFPGPWEGAETLLPRAWAAVFSEEDLGYDEAEIDRLGHLGQVVVCTRNLAPASLFVNGERQDIPTQAVPLIDPTGAGDIFAAAFFVWFYETGDPVAATRLAHIAAGQSIQGPGVSRVLGRDDLLAIGQGF